MPWICRRDWFLDKLLGIGGYGALADHKLSWGGGDMHIGVKPWLLGYKNWAVPTSSGIHIGPFPKVDITEDDKWTKDNKYRLYGKSGEGPHTIGFLVSCYVLGGVSMMERNAKAITERFGRYLNVQDWWDRAIEYGREEKSWLDSRKIMGFNKLLEVQPWNTQ
jgi:hypothetical protein